MTDVVALVCEQLDDELTEAEASMVLGAYNCAIDSLIDELAQQVLVSRNARSGSGSGAAATPLVIDLRNRDLTDEDIEPGSPLGRLLARLDDQ